MYKSGNQNEYFSELFICRLGEKLGLDMAHYEPGDTICYNMDRHTENFGFLRDIRTGEIVSMAPNYDNNIALISRGYPSGTSREHDGIIRFFREFVQSNETAKTMLKEMELPTATKAMLDECFDEIPIEADRDFIKAFISNGQSAVKSIIDEDVTESEDEESGFGLML